MSKQALAMFFLLLCVFDTNAQGTNFTSHTSPAQKINTLIQQYSQSKSDISYSEFGNSNNPLDASQWSQFFGLSKQWAIPTLKKKRLRIALAFSNRIKEHYESALQNLIKLRMDKKNSPEFKLFNTVGIEVYRGIENSPSSIRDISKLPSGIYYLKSESEKNMKKVLIVN